MADQKISQLTEITAVDTINDYFAIVDDTDSTTKKINPANVLKSAQLIYDGTAGRVLRISRLAIDDGTNASTLECTMVDRGNGDAIAATDNIAKDATTGSFSLSADGKYLTVEAAGLSGNVDGAIGVVVYNASGTVYHPLIYATANDISISVYTASGVLTDLTAIVDAGSLWLQILYITDA